MGLPGIKNLKYYILALFLIIILSISLTFPLYGRFPFPLSWDIWYHMRIVENFSNGNYFFDPVSFGPEGRIHTYPPLFHIIFLVFYKILNIAGLSLMDTARLMPTLLLSLSAISIFLLINKFYGMEIGFMTSFFVLVIPVSLDRGIITSPQSLAFILIPLGFLTYLIGLNEKKYLYISGIISSAIFYTHGLSFIVFYLSLIFFTIIDYLSIKKIRVSNLLFLSIITIVLSLPLIIHLALNGIASNIPYGGIFKISFYPVKLGYITMALAIPGALLLVLRKKEEDLMLLSWGFMAFMLSRNYITGLDLLPFRFIEFLAYPLAFYSSFAIYEFIKDMKKEVIIATILSILIISSFPAAEYVSKVKPMIGNEEYSAFEYIKNNTIFDDYTVASSWYTSPILGKISERKTVEGGYASGSWDYVKRGQDIKSLYSGNYSVIDTYNIKYVYLGPRETADFKNSESYLNKSSMDKLYSTAKTSLYVYWGDFDK